MIPRFVCDMLTIVRGNSILRGEKCMTEIFAKPAAIIEKIECGKRYILIQERQKENGGIENGMTEIPAGKIREYENIFDALRREVWEETGLKLTKIQGEEKLYSSQYNGYKTLSFLPFCVTQNVSGGYSIILQTFICEAAGELQLETNETRNIRWEAVASVEKMLAEKPEQFYPLHINALKKYFAEYPSK